MSDSRDLAGRRVLVTGASAGIGAATARLLGERGAVVGVHFNNGAVAAEGIARDIADGGGRAELLRADLLDESASGRLVAEAVARLGGLDALVNNAGGPMRRLELLEMNRAAWRDTFTLNAEAPFFLARDAFAHLQAHGGGRIVNVSSIGVKYGGSASTLHYAAAKAALENLTLGLARAGAPYRVLVNAVRPGVIATRAHDEVPADVRAARIGKIPLGRAGQPREVAEMIAFLLSAGGDFITGQILAVSGGD